MNTPHPHIDDLLNITVIDNRTGEEFWLLGFHSAHDESGRYVVELGLMHKLNRYTVGVIGRKECENFVRQTECFAAIG